jgi:hypothetical protein
MTVGADEELGERDMLNARCDMIDIKMNGKFDAVGNCDRRKWLKSERASLRAAGRAISTETCHWELLLFDRAATFKRKLKCCYCGKACYRKNTLHHKNNGGQRSPPGTKTNNNDVKTSRLNYGPTGFEANSLLSSLPYCNVRSVHRVWKL